MFRIAWRLTRGYRLRPWRSPYLLWRIETYWGLHAEQITFAQFWRFVCRRRSDFLRYLRWAASMAEQTKRSPIDRVTPMDRNLFHG